MEVNFKTDAHLGEGLNSERTTQRNGYQWRPRQTRTGSLNLAIQKLRKGIYFPSFLEPRHLTKKALTSVIQKAYFRGISSRVADDLVKVLGGTGIIISQVSRQF